MRIGDLDALFCQLWRKADPFKEQPLVKPSAVWSKAATMAREAPTIDPETIPVVRQLREELAQVTAERDAAKDDLEAAMKLSGESDEMGLLGFLCHVCSKNDVCDGTCFPEWRGPKKEE